MSLGLKTAKVEVMKGEDKGTLYLLHGKVVHASVRDLKGPEAFYEIIGWDAGRFHIMHGQSTSDINVTIDTMRMLFEADSVLNKRKPARHRHEPIILRKGKNPKNFGGGERI